jgi:hypothetical protein
MTGRQYIPMGGLVLAALLAGCEGAIRGVGDVIEEITAQDSVAVNLILIGDAGSPSPAGDPVLKALRAEVARDEKNTFVVFLGDNVYPRGLADSASIGERREGERILRAQVDAVLEPGGRGIMVPGNHDWEAGSRAGLEAIRRQDRWVDALGGDRLRMLPDQGCPGPHVIDFGRHVRLLALDTQYWLHDYVRPEGPGFPCGRGGEEQVVDSIRKTLASADGRRTVVVGHHPLASGGIHGGFIGEQDIYGRDYRDLRGSMARAFAADTPLIFAAGHEHNLQVFRRGGPAKYLLVSGAGLYGHTTITRALRGHLYVKPASGFMRVVFLNDGRVRLSVLTVDSAGRSTEEFSAWIAERWTTPPAQTPAPPPAARPAGQLPGPAVPPAAAPRPP